MRNLREVAECRLPVTLRVVAGGGWFGLHLREENDVANVFLP